MNERSSTCEGLVTELQGQQLGKSVMVRSEHSARNYTSSKTFLNCCFMGR